MRDSAFACSRVLCAAVVASCASGCGSQTPASPWWQAAAPSAVVSAPSAPAATLIHVSFEPGGLNGGATSVGTLMLSRPAPEAGMTIHLSSANAAVEVPASVSVPSGAVHATFTARTQQVSQDVSVAIAAASGGSSGRGSLDVWAVLPTSFSWVSEPGDPVGRGRFGRFTPQNTSFFARCDDLGSALYVTMGTIDGRGGQADVHLGAPKGTPLRPGTYEGATGTAFRRPGEPGIDVGIESSGCTARGRFVVLEADLSADGEVRRFVATFEQHCQNATGALRGELRLTGPFRQSGFPCLR